MKAITMQIQKFSRPGVILMATAVVIITFMVAANATQSITTPNAAFISYSVAPYANSAAITPATDRSVLVMGCTTSGYRGVGQVSLQHVPAGGMRWVGLHSSGTITAGSSAAVGTIILNIGGYNQVVRIEIASANTIRVHNGTGSTVAGNVTLIW